MVSQIGGIWILNKTGNFYRGSTFSKQVTAWLLQPWHINHKNQLHFFSHGFLPVLSYSFHTVTMGSYKSLACKSRNCIPHLKIKQHSLKTVSSMGGCVCVWRDRERESCRLTSLRCISPPELCLFNSSSNYRTN